MPIRIRISNLNKRRRPDATSARRAARAVLRRFKKKNALIDITFVGNRKIKVLNKKYMKRPRPTDVISFTLDKGSLRRASMPLIGDVYISSDAAYSNARRFGTSFKRELLLYVIHGVLHVIGFGDKSAGEKKKIRRLEEGFLNRL